MYNPQLTVDRINEILNQKNISKKSLNEICDISNNTINQSAKTTKNKKIPNGMTARNLFSIAKYLDCSTDYLLGLEDIPNRKQSNTATLSNDERELLDLFNCLSERGKGQIIERIKVIKEDEEKIKIKDSKLETA